jgi:hypothetical protein
LVVAAALALAACDDSNDSKAAPSASTAAVASTTTVAPAEPAAAVEVAGGFLDAYAAFDTERASSYLTEDALAAQWGTPDEFRMWLAFFQAQRFKQTVTGCEVYDDSGTSESVRCAYEYHAFHSDEIGLGPYTNSYWDFTIEDGKITTATSTSDVFTSGFSAELWQPFQAWVASTHPEDLAILYAGGGWSITEASIPLWDQRLTEWAATVNAGAE